MKIKRLPCFCIFRQPWLFFFKIHSSLWLVVVVRFFISIFVRYFTILRGTINIEHLRGIYYICFLHCIVKLQLLQYGPPFFFKGRCPFCSPKKKIKIMPLNLLFPLAINIRFTAYTWDDIYTNNGHNNVDSNFPKTAPYKTDNRQCRRNFQKTAGDTIWAKKKSLQLLRNV